MDFSLFLQEASACSFWTQSPNICFRGDEFSPLFFNALLSHVEKNKLLPYPKLRFDITSADKRTIFTTLNQSILGNYAVFWMSTILHEDMVKTKQDVLSFLFAYQGPHHVIYFLSKDAKQIPGKIATVVDIPSNIDFSKFEHLCVFFKQTIPNAKSGFIKQLFKETKTLPLDTACMLMKYIELINVRYLNDFSTYLAHITQAQPSLSQLSEYFFTGKAPEFFSLWATVEKEYPEMFWLSFWSEQLWKAHHVIGYLKKNNIINAKRMSFRLPYSFVNTYWKKFSQYELKHLYDHLYLIDMKIKRGGSSEAALSFFFFFYFFEKFQISNHRCVV
jgi:hypothetical protein